VNDGTFYLLYYHMLYFHTIISLVQLATDNYYVSGYTVPIVLYRL